MLPSPRKNDLGAGRPAQARQPDTVLWEVPGDTLFLLMSKERAPAMLVLTPDGRKALIPSWCLVQVGSQGPAQERPGATQTGRVG